MKIQRTPIVLLAIAALLGGVVIFSQTQDTAKLEQQDTAQKLFPFQESDIRAFTLKTPQQTLSFTKVPAASPAASNPATPSPAPAPSLWHMTAPKSTLANDGSVAFLLNLIATGKREKTLTVPATQLAEFGFSRPLATINVTLQDQKMHQLVLGNPDFNRSYLYAQVDPPAQASGNQTVHLVSLDFENAVTRPLAEWEYSSSASPRPTDGKSNEKPNK
ncbi:hypothetical protein OsccyDRAFT_2422 [Leptolyngbyaceae cyanobacterium JSC-12]|nr:hypothetical protein OsccyDRAFT_2422 [Leptolyngbyaceae cyanobacterium JSC-12]